MVPKSGKTPLPGLTAARTLHEMVSSRCPRAERKPGHKEYRKARSSAVRRVNKKVVEFEANRTNQERKQKLAMDSLHLLPLFRITVIGHDSLV
jgi:hypothetical protein